MQDCSQPVCQAFFARVVDYFVTAVTDLSVVYLVSLSTESDDQWCVCHCISFVRETQDLCHIGYTLCKTVQARALFEALFPLLPLRSMRLRKTSSNEGKAQE